MLQSFFNILFTVIEYAILLEVIFSWVLQGKTNIFIEIVHSIAGPFMYPWRILQEKLMPNMMIDFSPVFALLGISILRNLVSLVF